MIMYLDIEAIKDSMQVVDTKQIWFTLDFNYSWGLRLFLCSLGIKVVDSEGEECFLIEFDNASFRIGHTFGDLFSLTYSPLDESKVNCLLFIMGANVADPF